MFSLILFSLVALGQSALADEPVLPHLKAADGYAVGLYAGNIDGARSMTQGPKGTLFIGSRGAGNVYALRDGKLYTLAKSLDSPNGVAVKGGNLYVAEISRLLRFENIEAQVDAMAADPAKAKKGLSYQVIYKKLPTDRAHGWKFIAFGPDGALYVPVGAPCNICESKDPRYASILRFSKLDGSDPTVYATGIRNTVGFAWHPKTKVLWFTDNGRDLLGDDVPNDELDHAPKAGMNFGYPYCHQGDIADPEYGRKHPCSDFTKPDLLLGPHVAALGIRFLDENTAIYAQHGSWNRSTPIGYRVMMIHFKDGKPVSQEPFLEGFLTPEGKTLGRPVDVEVLSDRSVLVSDDFGNAIYRVAPVRKAAKN